VRVRGLGGLRGRLAVGTLLVLIVAIVVADVAAFVGLRQLADERMTENLALAADRSLALTRTVKSIDETVLDRMSPANVYFGFYDTDGELLLEHLPSDHGDLPLPSIPPAAALSAEPTLVSANASSEGVVAIGRILTPEQQIPVIVAGTPATVGAITVGITNYANVEALAEFIRLQTWIAVVLIALAIASTFVILRVGLRPLRAVADTAHEISQGDLSRRIPVTDEATEIGAVSTALNEAFDQAEGSEQRMRTFIADASHELRTPLATIHGWADLYLHDGVQEWDDVDMAMTRIRDESARMTELVDQLLTLARLDAQSPSEREDLDLGALAADVVDAVTITAPDHVIRLALEGPDEAHVLGDAPALRQLVTNLVANATRHTPPGTTVTVVVRTDDAGGPHAVLEVSDDGPGMSAEEMAHAFDRFWRADASRASAGGTGLGLSIVRATALAHRGTVLLQSDEGHGLTVTVRLPRANERRDSARPSDAAR
jgi:two-component system OmpR family sensor kinase